MARNFVIVGTQRTGSSALAETIGFHPDIACGWEWTQLAPRRSKIRLAERALAGDFLELAPDERSHMQKVFTPPRDWLGFRRLFRSSNKWMFHPRYAPALWQDRLEDHVAWLSGRQDIHIIHLIREDNIAWLKSKYFSKKTGLYVGKPYPSITSVKIPVVSALARVQSKHWVDARLSTLKDTNPYCLVRYEDFCTDKVDVANMIFKFLDCDNCKIDLSEKGGRKRQSTGDISDGILNIDDLATALRERGLMKFDAYRKV